MHISVVGLSHRTAPVEIRERLSIPEQTMETSLQSLRGNEQVLEASILSTCNRLEIYTLVRNPDLGVSAVSDFLSSHSGLETGELTPHLFSFHHEDAVDHLMRVAAGLDSLVLGEGQILSQVKKMMRLGQEHKSLGPILNRLLTQAVTLAKGSAVRPTLEREPFPSVQRPLSLPSSSWVNPAVWINWSPWKVSRSLWLVQGV